MKVQQIKQSIALRGLEDWGTAGLPGKAEARVSGVQKIIPGSEAVDTGIFECTAGIYRRSIKQAEVMHFLSGRGDLRRTAKIRSSSRAGTPYFSRLTRKAYGKSKRRCARSTSYFNDRRTSDLRYARALGLDRRTFWPHKALRDHAFLLGSTGRFAQLQVPLLDSEWHYASKTIIKGATANCPTGCFSICRFAIT